MDYATRPTGSWSARENLAISVNQIIPLSDCVAAFPSSSVANRLRLLNGTGAAPVVGWELQIEGIIAEHECHRNRGESELVFTASDSNWTAQLFRS